MNEPSTKFVIVLDENMARTLVWACEGAMIAVRAMEREGVNPDGKPSPGEMVSMLSRVKQVIEMAMPKEGERRG